MCVQTRMADPDKTNRDHHANQMNPNSDAHKARMDHHADQSNPTSSEYKAATDNRSNQMNPNNPQCVGHKQKQASQPGDEDDKK